MNQNMPLSTVEVADIFRLFGDAYQQQHKLPLQHLKAMSAIQACRTAALGGHIEECDNNCGFTRISYNPCRNRHCPKCQTVGREQWLFKRKQEFLPSITHRDVSAASFNFILSVFELVLFESVGPESIE
jgi:predicted Zn-ribbon and HTH transcriptional regulator